MPRYFGFTFSIYTLLQDHYRFCLISQLFFLFFEKCCFLPEIFVYLLCLTIKLPLLSGLSTAWVYLAKTGRSAGAGSLAYLYKSQVENCKGSCVN